MAVKLKFHEGKACDAVLQRIERRERASRTNLILPERDGGCSPVDLVCEVGGALFAFEHTGTEPFEGHLQLDARAENYVKPIETELDKRLHPGERVQVTLPLEAFAGQRGSEAKRRGKVLIETVVDKFPGIPIDRPGHRARPIEIPSTPEFPYPIHVFRSDNGGFPGCVRVGFAVPSDLEAARQARLQRVYDDHISKLAVWKNERNARTALIIEENDIQATRYDLISDVLQNIERNREESPDEIWLVSTAIMSRWNIWWLRVGSEYCLDLSAWGSSLSHADPDDLAAITANSRT